MRRFALVLVVALLSTTGCSLIEQESDRADVTHEETIPFEFEIDANRLCESSPEFDNCQSTSFEKANQKIPLPHIERDIDIDIPERTGEPKLADAAGQFKKITITEIDYEVTQASGDALSIAVPEVELHTGPKKATATGDEGVFLLTTFPRTPAGEDKETTIQVDQSAQQKTSDLFKKLVFSAIPAADPAVESGQDVPPHGKATVSVTIHAKFVVNPVENVQ